jgi:hypothetical protein
MQIRPLSNVLLLLRLLRASGISRSGLSAACCSILLA